jgi:hypothetical protein
MPNPKTGYGKNKAIGVEFTARMQIAMDVSLA